MPSTITRPFRTLSVTALCAFLAVGCQTTLTQLKEANNIYDQEAGVIVPGGQKTNFKTLTFNSAFMKQDAGEGAGLYTWDSDGGGQVEVGQKATGMDGTSSINALVNALVQVSAQRAAVEQAAIENPPPPAEPSGIEAIVLGILNNMARTGTLPAVPVE